MQKVLNRTLGLFLVIAMMALCMVPALAAKPMNTGKWYDDGMNEFIDKGYITGYGNGDYGPERNMTRAEFIAVVNKVMGYKDADMNAAAKFKDMDAGKWYYKPIAIALKEGFVKGNADGTMNPNGTITRQEAVTMLVNIKDLTLKDKTAARKSLEANEAKFKDVSGVANWVVDYVEAAVEDGIITGAKQADGMYLNPRKLLTRAEGVYMIMHLQEEEGIFVLMNIPYDAFYGTEESPIVDVDAVASATNKVGSSGLADGGYHSATTAKEVEAGAEGAAKEAVDGKYYAAVGGDNNAHMEGVTWPVKASDLDTVKALGGKEITDDSVQIVATAAHGSTTASKLEGAACLLEAPSYSYYVLKDEPAQFMKLKVKDKKASFSANEGEVVSAEAKAEVFRVSYTGHHTDLEIYYNQDKDGKSLMPEELADITAVNAMSITLKDGKKDGMVHVWNIWRGTYSFGWNITDGTKELDGATITNLRYYGTTVDGEYKVVDVKCQLELKPFFSGEKSAKFSDDVKSIELTGLDGLKNAKAVVSYSPRGGEPSYLTSAEGVAVTNGKVVLSAAPDKAVQNYTVTVTSDNYGDVAVIAANPNYVEPENSGSNQGGNGSGNGGGNKG